MTPPTITNTVSPAANANGWHTNDVTVTFYADDGLSGIASVTSPVTVTNEVIDELVEGIATDVAGNTASSFELISIDRGAPTVTGSPGDGDIVNSLRPPFVMEYSDEGSGADQLSLTVLLDGTNVTANFEAFAAGAIWVPTNDLAVGEHNWEITVSDEAGNEVFAEATFTIEDPATSGGASLSGINLSDKMVLPDVPFVWLQGAGNETNLTVSGSVNFGEPFAFSRKQHLFGRLVPLDFGTNIVVVTVSGTNGVYATEAFELIRGDRYRAAMTSPEAGAFVGATNAVVSGFVSAKIDEGTPNESDVVSVTVNGVATTLGSVDGNGNRSFQTAAPMGVGSAGVTAVMIAVEAANGQFFTCSAGPFEDYEVVYRQHTSQSWGPRGVGFAKPNDCGGTQWLGWGFHIASFGEWFKPGLLTSNAMSTVDEMWAEGGPEGVCFDEVDPDAFNWEAAASHVTEWIDLNENRSFLFDDDFARDHEQWDNNSDGTIDGEVIWFDGGFSELYMEFTAPFIYPPGTPVIFKFEGLDYSRAPSEPRQLADLKYLGQTPILTNDATGLVGYLTTVDGGATYGIDISAFEFPPVPPQVSVLTNLVEGTPDTVYNTITNTYRWFSFSNFRNADPKPAVAMLEVQWHHELPQSLWEDFWKRIDGLGLDSDGLRGIDRNEFGIILDMHDHTGAGSGLHNVKLKMQGLGEGKYVDLWEKWLKKYKQEHNGNFPTSEEVIEQLDKFKANKKLKAIRAKGITTNLSYTQWGSATDAVKAPIVSNLATKHAGEVRSVVKGKGSTWVVTRKVLKAGVVTGFIVFVVDASTGAEASQLVGDVFPPVGNYQLGETIGEIYGVEQGYLSLFLLWENLQNWGDRFEYRKQMLNNWDEFENVPPILDAAELY